MDILIAKGFQDLSDPAEPEPGMAMDLEGLAASSAPAGFEIARVESRSAFVVWVDVVNEALHGWAMLDAEDYLPLVSREGVAFYLALRDGTPVSTAATIEDDEWASLEFVSTLREHRRQGAATALCLEALRRLRGRGFITVTLRASHPAVPIYRKLAFRTYLNTTPMVYRR